MRIVISKFKKLFFQFFQPKASSVRVKGSFSFYSNYYTSLDLIESMEQTFDKDTMTATCRIKCKGSEFVGRFSKQEALKLGLLTRNIWKNHTDVMIKNKAKRISIAEAFNIKEDQIL